MIGYRLIYFLTLYSAKLSMTQDNVASRPNVTVTFWINSANCGSPDYSVRILLQLLRAEVIKYLACYLPVIAVIPTKRKMIIDLKRWWMCFIVKQFHLSLKCVTFAQSWLYHFWRYKIHYLNYFHEFYMQMFKFELCSVCDRRDGRPDFNCRRRFFNSTQNSK